MSKRSKSKKTQERRLPVPRGLWSRLMEVFNEAYLHRSTIFYLDIPNLCVLSLPRGEAPPESSTPSTKPAGWKQAKREANNERVRARLRDAPGTLAEIPCYSDKDEENDWRDFLQRFPSEKYRRQLHQARREFNGGPRDLLNRLVEDYPDENE